MKKTIDLTPLKNCFSPKPRTWWRWLNGNISREGITLDLEEIAAKGYCGVTFFNLGSFYPQGDVRFMTPEWQELFNFSVEECARLGLDFSFKHCDGWGASGGPWMEPADSMKWLVSRKITVEGGGPLEVNLPQPYTLREFYRDVKVLAFPAFDAVELPFDPSEITVRSPGWIDNSEALFDGELHSCANFGYKPGQPQHLDFILPQESELAGIYLHHGSRETVVGPMKCRLWQSQDGENYEAVAEVEMDQSKGSANFPAFRARYLRLEMLEWSTKHNGQWAFLAAVEFLPPGGRSAFSDIPEFMLKAAFWHRRRPLGGTRADDTVPVVDQSQVLDLTARMDADGTLRWEAPAGRWRVVRFGYTTTEHQNGPATDEGRGLECDKLDAKAVEKFFNGYAGKMLDANAKHCGTTITRLFHDSFEALAQNWTPALAEEFHQRRGYELWPWLLVMAGEHVESVEATERFLYDLRRTLSEMMADVYYATLNRLAESKGVRLLVQSAGEQQMMINPIAYSRQVGIPSTEFWIGKTSDSSKPYDGRPLEFCTNGSVYDAISVTKHRGIGVIPGESFTTKLIDYSITPRVLKRVGSKAFAVGFNQLEMHTYIHQPKEDMPGLQHYMFGIAFGRKVTWWRHADILAKYFERIQAVLQSGPTVADVLVYTGEEIPRSLEYAYNIEDPSELLPPEYDFDTCDCDSLLDWVTVENGRLLVNGEHEYRVMILPPSERMSLAVAGKLKEIVEAGIPVLGPKPSMTFGLLEKDREPELRALAEDLWDEQKEHHVESGQDAKAYVRSRIEPDFECLEGLETGEEILYQHRRTGEGDVYFVANVLEESREVKLSFRQATGSPSIVDPETGEEKPANNWAHEDERTVLTMHLAALQAIIVRFGSATEGDAPASAARQEEPRKVDVSKSWEVTFDPNWGGPESPVMFDVLKCWTRHEDERIRFYSGTAIYRKTVDLPEDSLEGGSSVELDLGDVREVAEVSVNGQPVGTRIFPPYRLRINAMLMPGENQLEIAVINTWNNRISGDDLHPAKPRFTEVPVKGYSANCERPLYTEENMLPSGLFGPVNILIGGRREH